MHIPTILRPRRFARGHGRALASAALGAMMLIATPGCILAPLIASNERKGSHVVAPKYTGLTGKSFAVVVAADRSIQASYPMLVGQITQTVSKHLKEQQDQIGASGWVPPEDVLGFQYQHPQWNTWTLQKLAEEIGVERLIFVDIQEFRLNEPGNQYLWKGAAGALVGVVEADADTSESFAFSEAISVQYPTKETALSPAQASGDQIEVMLAKRLVDRTAWLFFEHEEANIIDY